MDSVGANFQAPEPSSARGPAAGFGAVSASQLLLLRMLGVRSGLSLAGGPARRRKV